MTVKTIIVLACLVRLVSDARADDAPTTTAFHENGGWSGEVTATKWRGINTAKAWAIGHHTRANAVESCSGREGADRRKCVRDLIRTRPIEIAANCAEGIAWRLGEKERYQLAPEAMAGNLQPLEDEKAWTSELTHRGRWTVASWFQLLCPVAAKQWHIPE